MPFRLETFTIKNDGENFKFTEEGYLQASAYATRTGVFDYLLPDGSLFKEYRPAEEVFKPDSLDTLKNKPVTRFHPRPMLDSNNVTKHIKGITLNDVIKEDNLVKISVLIYDSGLITDITSGKMQELSCGYYCELEHVKGVTPEGENYDAIQRNIRQNHLAVVPKGRAGPQARLKLDARCDGADEIMDYVDETEDEVTKQTKTISEPKKDTKPKMKLNVNGEQLEVNDDVAPKIDTALKNLQSKIDSTQAQLDIEKAKPKTDNVDTSKLVSEKISLVNKVSKIVDSKEFNIDEAVKCTDRQLKEVAVKKAFSHIDTKDKSDDYVNTLFDAIQVIERAPQTPPVSTITQNSDSFNNLLKTLNLKSDSTDSNTDEAEIARQKTLDSLSNNWTKPVGFGSQK